MRAGWLVVMAGCSFQPSGQATTGDDAGSLASDATLNSIDARADAAPCPDSDGDGVCDAVDTWPCGPAPTAPDATLTMTANGGSTSFVVSAIDVDATGQLVVAAAQATVSLHLHYAITDTACSSACDDQLEVGWAPGNRTGCVFDAAVSRTNGASGTITNATVQLPAIPGVYDLRTNIGQNYSCTYGGANTWWANAPSADRTIAKVCVQ